MPRIVTFRFRAFNQESGGSHPVLLHSRDSRVPKHVSLVFLLAEKCVRERKREKRCSRTSIQPRYRVTCVTNEGTIRKVGILSGSRTAVVRFSGCALPALVIYSRTVHLDSSCSRARPWKIFYARSYVEWIATEARRRDEEVPRAVSSAERSKMKTVPPSSVPLFCAGNFLSFAGRSSTSTRRKERRKKEETRIVNDESDRS